MWALLIPGQTESGGSRWCFAGVTDSRGAVSSSIQAHFSPRSAPAWHVPLAVPAPPGSKVCRTQSCSALGSGCLPGAGTRHVAVLLQWGFFWLQQVLPKWAQSVLGGRRCFPLEDLPFPPTPEASCVEWAVSNRAWDEKFSRHHLPSSPTPGTGLTSQLPSSHT